MKTGIFMMTICMAFTALGSQAEIKNEKPITGNTDGEFGKYTIVQSVVPMQVNGVDLKTYTLSYENADRKVQIGVISERRCTDFILKTDMFEICYVCNRGVFGVKKMDREYATISKDLNDAVLDNPAYYTQRVITQTPKSEQELLGLIACYFPMLMKEQYRAKF